MTGHSLICPTVLAATADEFADQMELAASLAERVQIDLMDGELAPSRSVNPAQVWWPETVRQADIHLMFARPAGQLETLVSLKPGLVIIHAEAEGDLVGCLRHLQGFGIKAGVALLKSTSVQSCKELIDLADHVLLFSGELGHFGGQADLDVLGKVAEVRSIRPDIEIGWDGGANQSNVSRLATSGIDVINVGSAIQQADRPDDAYAKLESLALATDG